MALAQVIDPALKIPGTYIEIVFGVGPATAAGAPIKLLMYGNKLSAGSATVEKAVAVRDEDEARTLFGAGSELFLMCRAALRANKLVDLSAIPVAESAGAKAAHTVTYTGPATGAGTTKVYVGGEPVSVAVASGDSVTIIAAAVRDAINAKTDWPVTASAAVGVVTVTAKQNGLRGNYIALRCTTDAAGTTVTAGAAYLAAGGASDDPTAALAAVAARKFDYHVAPYIDSTNINLFEAHVDTYAGPLNGRRQRFIACHNGTASAAQTVSAAVNAVRGQILRLEDPDDTPAIIAAGWAAVRALYEARKRSYNLDGLAIPYLKPQNDDTDWPTGAELASDLNNGVTPLRTLEDGTVVMVRSITNRHKDSAGNLNYNTYDSSKVTVPDYIADDLAVGFPAEFANFNLAPDDPDGDPPPSDTATPSLIKSWIHGRLKGYEEDGLIVNVDALIDELKVEIAEAPDGRVNARIPLDVIEGLHQFGVQLRQIG